VQSEKLLIFLKPTFLGDAVMATPLLNVLAEAFERPVVLASPHIQEMLKEDCGRYEMLAPGPQKGIRAMIREARRLREMQFGTVVLVNRSIRSALIAKLARIPTRVGHPTEFRGPLLTMRVPFSPTRFEAASYGDLVEAMGIPGDFTHPTLTITHQELKLGHELAQGATVGVQPGARFADKRLPLEGLAEVVDRLYRDGQRVVLIGGHGEDVSGVELQKKVSQPMLNLIGKCQLRESMGLIANLKACIGASTGIMHIAAAVGCPTVTVFGETLSSKWGHNYPPHKSIQIRSGSMADMNAFEVSEAALSALIAYP
jgi:heptosyltransferase-2